MRGLPRNIRENCFRPTRSYAAATTPRLAIGSFSALRFEAGYHKLGAAQMRNDSDRGGQDDTRFSAFTDCPP